MPPRKPPPEAQLIASKLATAVPRMSRRQAARRAGISETRWRQIEKGLVRVHGHDYPETAPADTLASMARAIGITPAELEAAGRSDAATYLAALGPLPPPDEGGHRLATSEEVREIIARLDRLERELRGDNGGEAPGRSA